MIPTYRFRHFHRGLSVVIGIQILLWVASGIWFAWTDLDEIHGDHLENAAEPLPWGAHWAAPSEIPLPPDARVMSCDVVQVGEQPLYRLHFVTGSGQEQTLLADALTGDVRGPLTREEAVALAVARFRPEVSVREVELLNDDLGGHHEYRGGPLPVWRIAFDHPSGTNIYVAANEGTVMALRHRNWRIFDFLWMLHTMDFQGRDDINNPLLRGLSAAALLVVVSGFALWFVTRPKRRRGKK